MGHATLSSRRRAVAVVALLLTLSLAVTRAETPGADTRPQAASPAFTAPWLLVPQARAFKTVADAAPVKLVSIKAVAKIVEKIATTRIEIVVQSAGSAATSAELLVPVPRRSKAAEVSVDGVEATIANKIYRGAAARTAWAAAATRAASLEPLEFSPFEALLTKAVAITRERPAKITISYETELKETGDRLDYVLPRSVSAEASEVPWEIAAHVRQTRPIGALYSPTLGLGSSEANADKASLTLSGRQIEPGPFELSILLGGPQPTATFFTYPEPDSDGGCFLMVGAMPATHAERQTKHREVLIVIDRSGSMRGEKFDQARRAIVKAIRQMRDGELFNIIDYASEISALAPRPVVKSDATVADAARYIEQLDAVGGTDVNAALMRALDLPPAAEVRPLVLFLTDGVATSGETREAQIRANVRGANVYGRQIYTVGLGYDVNAPLLDSIATTTGGTCTFVPPGADVEVKLGEAFDQLSDASLGSAYVEPVTAGLISDVYPAKLGNLSDSERFVVAGRYNGTEQIRVRLVGEEGETKGAYEFTLDPAAARRDDDFVGRRWATSRINALAAEVLQNVPDPAAKPNVANASVAAVEIVRLAIDYGAVTSYTEFLLDDSWTLADQGRLVARIAGALETGSRDSRMGASAVNRAMMLRLQARGKTPTAEPQNERDTTRLRYAGGTTLVRRENQWLDVRLMTKSDAVKPDATVLLGSEGFADLRDRLTKQRRAGVFALPGAVVTVDDKAIQFGAPVAKR